ncbi:MAG: hypothetical protein QM767_04650 [Anaeromyxobacter sp.]
MRPLVDLAAGDDPGRAAARFAEARGKRVFEVCGVAFAEYRGPFHISLPWQRRVDLDPAAVAAALRRERAWAVRYPTLTQPGWPGGLYALWLPGFGLDRLQAERRRRARRGLETTACRELAPDELEALGLELNLETMARHGRFDPEFGDPAGWRRFVAAVRRCPEVSALGGFVDGRLEAYLLTLREGRWLHLLYKNARDEALRRNVPLALDCWALQRAGADPGLQLAEAGFPSLRSGDRLDLYKRELGFSLVPFDVGLRFHPLLSPLLATRLSAAAAATAARLRPASGALDLAAHVLAGAHRTRSADPVPAR